MTSSGGGYFYLDNRDRAVVPTTTRHVFVLAVGAAGFTQERDYDLTGAVAAGDKIISALPDWSGRLWFASTRGVVGTVAPSGQVRAKQLGEGISNSFAVDDQGGVYVVTQKALYRLDAAADGSPAVSWREQYRNSGIAKPGQSDAGSGTTPTVMEGGRVSIADNDDPMNVVVYKKARQVGGSRVVVHRARVLEGRLVHRPVSDRGAQLDRRGEQLRARGPHLGERRQDHHAGDRARGREQERPRLPPQVAQQRDRAVGRAEALDRDGPRLHLHEAAPHR